MLAITLDMEKLVDNLPTRRRLASSPARSSSHQCVARTPSCKEICKKMQTKRVAALAFARWAGSQHITMDHLGDADITAFVKRSPAVGPFRLKFELRCLRLLLEYLRAQKLVPLPAPVDASLGDSLLVACRHATQGTCPCTCHLKRPRAATIPTP